MPLISQPSFDDPATWFDIPRPIVTLASDYPRGHRIAAHRHARAQLVYASQGVMTVTAAAGSWVVPPQRAVWMPAGDAHAIRVDRDLSMRSLYIRPDAGAGLPGACRVVTVSALLRALILRAMTIPPLYDEDGPDGRVLRVLLDELHALPSAPLHLHQPKDPRLKRVTDALQAEPADRRPLDAWARHAGASPRTLARLFLAESGMGFRVWRQRARLLRALVALADDTPVTAVAFDAGYDSPSAFIAAFKREFGTTPARYFRDEGE